MPFKSQVRTKWLLITVEINTHNIIMCVKYVNRKHYDKSIVYHFCLHMCSVPKTRFHMWNITWNVPKARCQVKCLMWNRDFLHVKSCSFCKGLHYYVLCCTVVLYVWLTDRCIYFNHLLPSLIIPIDWIYITLSPDARNALRYVKLSAGGGGREGR
jgi:hypothetical protein